MARRKSITDIGELIGYLVAKQHRKRVPPTVTKEEFATLKKLFAVTRNGRWGWNMGNWYDSYSVKLPADWRVRPGSVGALYFLLMVE